MASNIFISYSGKDNQRIVPILGTLKTIQNLTLFISEDSMPPGAKIDDRIINEIKGCNLFLVFYSISSKQSSYVQQEIGVARANNKMIIPILLDGTKPEAMLLNINYVDLSDSSKFSNEFNRLYHYISSNFKKQQLIEVAGSIALLFICIAMLGKK
ncbi:MAG: toll/interleukin-1 receptor domain-containing protein [Phycisphaerae bacterium]|jgi:hypothetical protein